MPWRFGTTATMVLLTSLQITFEAGSARASDFELSLPIDCRLGDDCFVQNYVDIDPGPGILTVTCQAAAYDGHKGTDFRILNINRKADVIASAPGIVRAIRDEIPDALMRSDEDRAKVSGRECGNGVVIVHEGGWETQYCHLRLGSVVVAQGDQVERGEKLGEVGSSGASAFAHVHLSLRKDGNMIDPFLGDMEAADERLATCASGTDRSPTYDGALWQSDVRALLKDAQGTIIQTGFADSTVKPIDLELGVEKEPGATSPVFVFFARLINVQEGDRVALRILGPEGVMAESDGTPMERQKAQWVSYAGRKLRADTWPSGEYVGTATLIRDGEAIQQRKAVFSIED